MLWISYCKAYLVYSAPGKKVICKEKEINFPLIFTLIFLFLAVPAASQHPLPGHPPFFLCLTLRHMTLLTAVHRKTDMFPTQLLTQYREEKYNFYRIISRYISVQIS